MPKRTKPVLEVSGLTKRFKELTAVDNVSFKVREGEIVGLLGPNGAGKTTTIQMLLGVLTPTKGKIRYFGKDFTKHREEVLQKINFCSSYIRLPWRMTVQENLEVMARLYEVPDRRKRIDKLLEAFEMREYKDEIFASLSAGQQMRVILAKSFLNYPQVILLDEPTASLDPDVAEKVRDFLAREQKEFRVSMLFTSHNMAEVEELCDRVIFLHKGNILAEDTPEGLAGKIETTRVDLLLDGNLDEALEICTRAGWKAGVDKPYLKVELKENEVARLLISLGEAGISYREISIDKPDLEDFFLKVAKEEHES